MCCLHFRVVKILDRKCQLKTGTDMFETPALLKYHDETFLTMKAHEVHFYGDNKKENHP